MRVNYPSWRGFAGSLRVCESHEARTICGSLSYSYQGSANVDRRISLRSHPCNIRKGINAYTCIVWADAPLSIREKTVKIRKVVNESSYAIRGQRGVPVDKTFFLASGCSWRSRWWLGPSWRASKLLFPKQWTGQSLKQPAFEG